MHVRMALFILVALTVLTASSYYVGHRLVTRWPWPTNPSRVMWLTVGAFVFVQILGPILYRSYPSDTRISFIFYWFLYTTLGVFSCLFFYTFAADVVLGLWKLVASQTRPVDLERRSFLTAGFLTLATAAVGSWQAIAGPKIYEVDIPLPNLPKEFDGFKIVQISDLHAGPTIGLSYVENVVAMANQLAPDLIVLTGDFIDGSVQQLRDVIAPLRNLRSQHGTYFITGNHEYYWGVTDWLEEFRRLGAHVLLNEHVIIRQNNSSFLLAGVSDYHAAQIMPEHASDPKKALAGAPEHTVKILLAHQPASYQEASALGFDLQLSGHTHGGQYFPWNYVVALFHRYYKGLNKHKNMWIYVSRGTGYWGPPLRTGVPSEITLLRLRC